ncbi:uncharacterized protein C8A04DRAFT_16064 [Dichotomopilus funicola]|uniref:Heterokaryon incompatibility domain-containing protein n=1 Tax=Dichotomopilus funicola TaxID=1934379 RepID=A0AAN6ZIV4_9PEZI|nr:hypothetical protein C8A04DRAFT_16064 [Dichotomopilus funicola]
MRLIDTSTLRLISKHDGAIPPYAILSHTWGTDEEEVSFQEWQSLSAVMHSGRLGHLLAKKEPIAKREGFAKIRDAARLAESQGYQYLWVDTCCIDKTSSAELSEAINSMFRWYRNAAICYALLSDVVYGEPPTGTRFPGYPDKAKPDGPAQPALVRAIRSSRWFKRGWTLQELIAPEDVFFYSKQWCPLGSKLRGPPGAKARDVINPELISEITGIDLHALQGDIELEELSVASRMRWAANRETTRAEDKAYCLMGIFGVNMPLLYGEGDRAFIRLQEEILKSTDDQSIFAWKCPPDNPLRFQLCGLLAPSPSFFAAAALKPLPRDPSRVSAPFSMTNAGLHIRLFLKAINPTSGAHDKADETSQGYYGVLACAPYVTADGEAYSAAIHLSSLGGDQYARVYPQTMSSLPSSLLANPGHGDGFQYIYVKQFPAYGLPEIHVGPFHFGSHASLLLDNPIEIVAAYPDDTWNESALTLKPTMTLPNTVLGAFRYALAYRDGRLGDPVDVFVGLGPGSEGPRMFWCAQQGARRWGSLAEIATDFDSSTITKKMRTIPQDQHPFFNVLARVLTVRLHTRTMIRLSLSEIHESTGVERFGPVAGGSIPLWAAEIDSNPIEIDKQTTPASVPSMASLQDAQPFVIEESWDTSLGFGVLKQSAATLQTRIRVRAKAADPPDLDVVSQDYWPLRHLVVSLPRPIRIRLDGEPRSWKVADDEMHVQRYFSLLLAQACVRNDVDSAAELLRSPLSNATVEVQTCLQSPDAETPLWHTTFRKFRPLHWAVLLGHRDILKLLLAHGADVLSITGIRLSVIHLAVVMGRVELLQDLMRAIPESWGNTEPDWFERTDVKEPIAHLAASYITSNAVAGILERVMRTADDPDPDSEEAATVCTNALYNTLHETPLHRAAANGNLAAAKAILELAQLARTEVDPKDHNGRTPLWHAAAAGAHDVAELLLHHGADRNVPDDKGWIPLHAACRGGHARAMRRLLEHDDESLNKLIAPENPPPISAFHLAVLSGNADTLRTILSLGVGVVDPNEELACAGRSVIPLHIAVCNGWLECVRLFYELGCDITEERNRKQSADTLIVEPQGGGTVVLHVRVGSDPSPNALALHYGHYAVMDYIHERRLLQDAQGPTSR